MDTRDSQSRIAGVSIEGHVYSRVVALRNLNLGVILMMFIGRFKSITIVP